MKVGSVVGMQRPETRQTALGNFLGFFNVVSNRACNTLLILARVAVEST